MSGANDGSRKMILPETVAIELTKQAMHRVTRADLEKRKYKQWSKIANEDGVYFEKRNTGIFVHLVPVREIITKGMYGTVGSSEYVYVSRCFIWENGTSFVPLYLKLNIRDNEWLFPIKTINLRENYFEISNDPIRVHPLEIWKSK